MYPKNVDYIFEIRFLSKFYIFEISFGSTFFFIKFRPFFMPPNCLYCRKNNVDQKCIQKIVNLFYTSKKFALKMQSNNVLQENFAEKFCSRCFSHNFYSTFWVLLYSLFQKLQTLLMSQMEATHEAFYQNQNGLEIALKLIMNLDIFVDLIDFVLFTDFGIYSNCHRLNNKSIPLNSPFLLGHYGPKTKKNNE